MGDNRSNCLLIVDGIECGFLKSFTGGNTVAEVVEERQEASYYSKKHIGAIVYESFDVGIDLSMNRMIYYWIMTSWSGNLRRRSGRVIIFNDNKEFEFYNGIMTEISIPSADADTDEAKTIKIKILPEHSRFNNVVHGLSDEDLKRLYDKYKSTRRGSHPYKEIISSKFRLDIDGLDCTRVRKIDSFTVRLSDKISFPDLKITLSKASAKSWTDWFEDFVVQGNNSDNQERNGSLTFFTADLKTELVHINLYNLGIFKLSSTEIGDSNNNSLASVEAELYCERMEFQVL